MQRRNNPMGIALKSTDSIVCWYNLCYGFCPSLSLNLPPNSPTMYIIYLPRPGCAPWSSKFDALCGKRVWEDMTHHWCSYLSQLTGCLWGLLQCPFGYFCLFLASSWGKRDGCLPPLRTEGKAEHTGTSIPSLVRCGAVHCYLPVESSTACEVHIFYPTCICCQRG